MNFKAAPLSLRGEAAGDRYLITARDVNCRIMSRRINGISSAAGTDFINPLTRLPPDAIWRAARFILSEGEPPRATFIQGCPPVLFRELIYISQYFRASPEERRLFAIRDLFRGGVKYGGADFIGRRYLMLGEG